MLGKDHVNISIAAVFPFLIPLIFSGDSNFLIYFVVFMFCVLVGSIVPDADCGGKATIYYKFRAVDWFMKKIVAGPIVWLFSKVVSKKANLEYEVTDGHRGIIHAPIGILFSTLMLSLPILLVMLIFGLFSLYFILAIFSGLLIGQFLHIFEDSCTVSGINWAFPFGTKLMKGEIYTFSKEEGKKDIRPIIYAVMFYGVGIILVILYSLIKVNFSILIIYLLLLILISFLLVLIYFISKSKSKVWMREKVEINNFKKVVRRIGS